jgi:lipoprotein-releasing system permease protein
MSYELLVGWRYTRARRAASGRSHFVSFISLVSMAGVALGVAALIVVLSVVNGFEREFRAGILGVTAHVQATGFDGTLEDWRAVAAVAARLPEVEAVAPFVNAQGLFSKDAQVRGTLLRGIDPALEARAADIDRYLREGAKLDDLVAGEMGVILGAELARLLDVKPGDRIALVAPRGGNGGEALPRLQQLRVVGLFSVGMHDFDSTLALAHIDDVRKLFELGDRVSGVRLRIADPLRSRYVAAQLATELPRVAVTEWTRSNANLFHAVQTSKTMVVMVVSLLIAIAAFNIVASLVMAVDDKRRDIAILRTLGASPAGVMRVFIVQGAAIGVVGTLFGVVLGVLLAANVPEIAAWVERVFGFKALAPEVYHISQLPSQLRTGDVILTASVALGLCFAATLYPSYRAATLRPAEALRYE